MIQTLSREEFAGLGDEWDALDDRGPLFSTHAWLMLWLTYYGGEEHVMLIQLENGILQAGVLFRVQIGLWSQELAETPWPWIASRPENEAPYAAFLEYLAERRDVREVKIVHAPQSLGASLESSPGYLCLTSFARNSRAVDVSVPFAAYEKSLGKRVRHNVRRHEKHMLAEMPDARLVRHDDEGSAFAVIEEVEADSWKEHTHTSIASSVRDAGFYRALFSMGRCNVSTRVYSLECSDGPLAYILCVVHRGVLYALKTSYRETMAKLSPGTVLHTRLFQKICNDEPEILRFELLGADSPRKRHLATANRELYDYRLLKKTVRNRAYAFVWTKIRPAVKEGPLGPLYSRVRKRLRPE